MVLADPGRVQPDLLGIERLGKMSLMKASGRALSE